MSLSADEKLRVAHRLDALGIDLIEAGFPASNPKEQELFRLLGRETFGHADIAAFGMTRRRDVAADADPALRVLADSLRAGVHARRQDLGAAPRQGRARRPRREPAHDRRVRRLPGRPGQARRLRRRALLRRLRRRRRLRAALPARGARGRRRDRRALRHQRRHAARPPRDDDGRGRGRGRRRGARGHPLPRRRRLRRGQLAGRRGGGRHPRAGHDQRLRRALRQRQPGHDRAQPAAQARAHLPHAGAARASSPTRRTSSTSS